MLNFYPGPSKLHPNIEAFTLNSLRSGIVERNHRSSEFAKLYQAVKLGMQEKLGLPQEYEVVFTSSATECWEIITESLVVEGSLHVVEGAFGEKWYEYAKKIKANCKQEGSFSALETYQNTQAGYPELLAVTHNETSNGTAIRIADQKWLREQFPSALIAYDATSSMAGVSLAWELGDIWFASVQKCFGLPSGLALLILSPQAIVRARNVGAHQHYNSLPFILDNAEKGQTHYTPNILTIDLLRQVLEASASISKTDELIRDRASWLYSELSQLSYLRPYVEEEANRSETVICLRCNKETIEQLKTQSVQKDILLGNGYGQLKTDTIRIANFPAIPDEAYYELLNFLKDFEISLKKKK